MATLNDIRETATSVVSLGPLAVENHFTATAKVLGITTVYLLKGEDADLEATIVGRIELGSAERSPVYAAIVYKGGNLKGGAFAGTVSHNLYTALNRLAA